MTFVAGKYYGGGWPAGRPRGVADPLLIGDLRRYMSAYGKTVRDMAVAIGVDDTAVSRWIRGLRNPSQATAAKLRTIVQPVQARLPLSLRRKRMRCSTCPVCGRERRSDRRHKCGAPL